MHSFLSLTHSQVFEKYRNVIITSGTLSPLDFYPKILSFTPKVAESLPMSLTRNCICPLIVTKGSDQVRVPCVWVR
jgi:DNA excision repair protein ERCC-2